MESVSRAVAANTAVQYAARFASGLLGFATVAVMARALGREGFGAYTTATAFIQIFAVLVDFGLTTATLQMTSATGADRTRILANALGLRLVSAAGFLALAPLVALAFPYDPGIRLGILILVPAQVSSALVAVVTTLFQRTLTMGRAALAEVAGRAAQLIGALIIVALGGSLLWFIAVITIGNVIHLAVAWQNARRVERIQIGFDRAAWRNLLRFAWPIGISIAFNVIYLRADTVILSLTRTQAEVGLYGAAYRVIDVLTAIPFLFMGLVLPLMTAAWTASDRVRLSWITQKAFDFLSIIAIPIFAGGLVLGGPLMRLVGGVEFEPAGPLLAVLLGGLAAIMLGTVAGHGVVAAGLQKRMIKWYAIDAALALALYAILIPRFGAPAAAGITVFSELFAAGASTILYLRATQTALRFPIFLRALLASALMAGALAPIRHLSLLFTLPAGIIIYFILVIVFGALPVSTLKEFTKKTQGPA